MTRPARARIDLAALARNFRRARAAAPGRQVLAVIKANGYGHGALRCAGALAEADGFAVASVNEALHLRSGGVGHRILLLGGIFHADELDEAARQRLDLVVHDAWQFDALDRWQGRGRFDVWLKVDTGMHRLGVPAAECGDWLHRLAALDCVQTVRVMTHLACADVHDDPHTKRQLDSLARCVAGFDGEISIANSAGVLGWPASHADWVRPGIMLYGSSPFVDGDAAADGLDPVMHLESDLIAIRDLGAGECIGYGAAWQAQRAMRMGVAALGYGDGYPRCLDAGTPVLVDGQPATLAGRVSMDLVTLDLTDTPGAHVGSTVRFWGSGLSADTIARRAGTIAYELFTGVNPRVARVYE